MANTKIYRVPVYYTVCEYVCVKAESEEQAQQYVIDNQDSMGTHCGDAYYMDDSYEVEPNEDSIMGYDEESRAWDKGESYSKTFYDATVRN